MTPSGRFYAFGPSVLDGLRGMLWQYGTPVPLTPRVIQLLAAIVARAGEILSTHELIYEVWGGPSSRKTTWRGTSARLVAYDGEFSGERLNQLSNEWRTA